MSARATGRPGIAADTEPTSLQVPLLVPLPAPPTQADGIGSILRRAIGTEELAPGSLHSVQKLALRLGVSRTPVREALLGLAKEGLVRFERNRGVRILENSLQDVEDIFELREWLEVPAVRQAASRASAAELEKLRRAFEGMSAAAQEGDTTAMWRYDGHFHEALLAASGNRWAARTVDGLRAHVLRLNNTRLEHGRSVTEILEAHSHILESVEQRRGDQAARLMRGYLRETKAILTGDGPGAAR